MNPPKLEFSHASLEDRRSIAAYVRALIEGFESGEITFTDPQGEIRLQPEGLMRFRLRAFERPEQVRVRLDISWKPGHAQPDQGPLTIGVGKVGKAGAADEQT